MALVCERLFAQALDL
ncbi:expressed protein [Echinococcus multilocularis]|uniref:Uncharacterized protein n=2 Tax=Echinococcus TaxID=6209 RepID=A0A068WG03_ECHGR|nr:hypothetical protein EgrG_000431900 [Echinococcus granulosus]CDS37087.1 expressed protein [Echinococcus multilocularis]